MKNAIEKLENAILEKNSRIVAGLDPKWSFIPKEYYGCEESANDIKKAEIFNAFGLDYIDAIADLVPAIKINIAFFEAVKAENVFWTLADYAQRKGLFVIGDVKRADIGSTSEAYANAYLGKDSPLDAITINPYFGTDSVKPFVKKANENEKAIFVLVKTSNPSSSEIQDLNLDNGLVVFEHVADLVSQWGNYTPSSRNGYKAVAAVVGATHPEQAEELRKRMNKTFFLVPGYGAQGATADDVAVNFDTYGLGAIVNSSRGIMCAYQKEEYKNCEKWTDATRRALRKAVDEINQAVRKQIEAQIGN